MIIILGIGQLEPDDFIDSYCLARDMTRQHETAISDIIARVGTVVPELIDAAATVETALNSEGENYKKIWRDASPLLHILAGGNPAFCSDLYMLVAPIVEKEKGKESTWQQQFTQIHLN